MTQTQNQNLRISIDCYRDQFRKQLVKLEPRLLRYANVNTIIFYYYSGVNETDAVNSFIESHSSILGE